MPLDFSRSFTVLGVSAGKDCLEGLELETLETPMIVELKHGLKTALPHLKKPNIGALLSRATETQCPDSGRNRMSKMQAKYKLI